MQASGEPPIALQNKSIPRSNSRASMGKTSPERKDRGRSPALRDAMNRSLSRGNRNRFFNNRRESAGSNASGGSYLSLGEVEQEAKLKSVIRQNSRTKARKVYMGTQAANTHESPSW